MNQLKKQLNNQANSNFSKAKLWHFALAVGIFAIFLGVLQIFGLSDAHTYPHIQKDAFLAINALYSNPPPYRIISRN